MTPYKVIVRNGKNWRGRSATTLGVSVNNPNWYGDKFASILEFAAEHFRVIRIDVTDALYRHGFMAAGMTSEEALDVANSRGALWLTQHAEIIQHFPIKPIIVRWAEWYKHPDFEKTLAAFRDAYDADLILKNAVHEDITEFYRRRNRAATPLEYQTSRDCFIEELAVFSLQAQQLPSVKIYPGEELRCCYVVRNGLVSGIPTYLQNDQYARVKLHSRGDLERQAA